ncbi:MAG TPA: M48 family metallopeptidase [Rhizomicrobium sp.]|jgi:heat shock protein HtpX|nr:M48 family metallopeptidase [Rhizomicrobium sp.]
MSAADPVATLGLTAWRSSNNTKSILMLAAFPALLLLLLGVMALIFDAAMGSGRYGYGTGPWQEFGLHSVLGTGTPLDFALSVVATWWPVVLGIAAIWVMLGYVFNDAIIHLATGAKPVARADQPELYNLVENLCISRGLRMPKLYIIDTDVMNAYASGIDDKSYAITVTSGLLQALNREELEAVLAHELTHIIDRDTRLLIITVVFVGMISFLAQLLWRSIRIAAFTRSRRRGGGGVILMVVIAAVVMFVGYLLALLLRFAISRRRELLADAGSVELTKNPDALIAALLKISKNPELPHVPSEVKQMMFENPPSAFDFGGLFSTHPSIEKRVQILQGLGGRLPAEPAASSAPVTAPAAAHPGPWGDSPAPDHHGPWG